MGNVVASLRPYFLLELAADSETDILKGPTSEENIEKECCWQDFELFLANLMDHIVKFGSFLWVNLSFYNLIIILLKHVPTIIFAYKTIHSLRKASYQRRLRMTMDIAEIETEVKLLDQKVEQQRMEVAEKRKELTVRTERFIKLRSRVRDLIAGNSALRVCLQNIAIWGDRPVTAAGEDTNLVGEILQKLNYDEEILEEQKISEVGDLKKSPRNGYRCTPPSSPDNTLQSVSSRSSGDGRGGGGGGRDSRFRVVKVTNIYKVAYTKKGKQTRQKRHSKNILLKKKIDSIQRLLQEWHKSLNIAINKKLAQCTVNVTQQPEIEMPPVKINYDIHTMMNHTDISESDSDVRNSGDADMYYENYGWPEYPYQLPKCNRPDPTTLMELNFHGVYGQNMNPQSHCECNGPQGSKVLFILPDDRSSEVEISEMQCEEEKIIDFGLICG